MVLGHFGIGLGAKRFAPQPSLGTFFIAVQWADLLWPVLLILNIEKVTPNPGNPNFPLDFVYYPITHSLVMGIVWGALFGLLYWLVKRDSRGALILGICVVSHWLLDYIVHSPDLPVLPTDNPKVGLGLWSSPIGTAVVEGAIFLIGLLLYLRATRARNRTGNWSLWLLVILLVANQVVGSMAPMPSSQQALGWGGLYQWIFILLGYWVDRNRTTTELHPHP